MDRIGKQLVDNPRAPHLLRDDYLAILEFYQSQLDDASTVLNGLGFAHTSRVKTLGTLGEKLAREPATKLSRVNDLAGARIVIRGNRKVQDDACRRIATAFTGSNPRPPQLIDRRMDPRAGYRAVHVVVYPQNFPVEIQVRTLLQDLWAQIYEGLADQWGRQIRYGEPPSAPDCPVVLPVGRYRFHDRNFDSYSGSTRTRRSIVDLLGKLSDLIDSSERVEVNCENMKETASDARTKRAEMEEGASGTIFRPGDNGYEVAVEGYLSLRRLYDTVPPEIQTDSRFASELAEIDSFGHGDALPLVAFLSAFEIMAIMMELSARYMERQIANDMRDIAGVLGLIAASGEQVEGGAG